MFLKNFINQLSNKKNARKSNIQDLLFPINVNTMVTQKKIKVKH